MTAPSVTPANPRESRSPGVAESARRVVLGGAVQGVGMRPAIARLAADMHLAGYVANSDCGVEIEVEGSVEAVAAFSDRLPTIFPEMAKIRRCQLFDIEPAGYSGFEIRASITSDQRQVDVPVDLATCPRCLEESLAPNDRRYGYPFTTCTDCGPRYSITTAMPYDRPSTTMNTFGQCAECQREYTSVGDRRFHSQTNCCPRCGPRLSLFTSAGELLARDADAVRAAVSALLEGRIVAVKGLGGYQLLADATNQEAVVLLRLRKQRASKPLAVLVCDIEEAERIAILGDTERKMLVHRTNPIVVVPQREGSPLAPAIGPNLRTLGVLLPTTPLHEQLARGTSRPLVATSGNDDGLPLAYEDQAAQTQLAAVTDLFLHHDRPIVNPIDDSVVVPCGQQPMTIRLARGLAPLPLDLPARRHVLALGGQQKSAVALANGSQVMLGPHIGDLDSVPARERLLEQIRALSQLYDLHPEVLVHDLHPDYFTTRWAIEQRLPCIAVQHHYAHVAAGMLEHEWLDRKVLGIAWDGAGYGPDGTIWGGEFLLADILGYERVGNLRTFRLPGGDAAAREPWRMAVSLVADTVGDSKAAQLKFGDSVNASALISVLRTSRFSPLTTSAGRLFDGVAALILGITHVTYEGEAAACLEAACDITASGEYMIAVHESNRFELDWRPLIAQILADREAGQAAGVMATRFHRALVRAMREVAHRFSSCPVVLGGGVFQNRQLLELANAAWSGSGQPLGQPERIPPNDGGLAAGQLAVALAKLDAGNGPICV